MYRKLCDVPRFSVFSEKTSLTARERVQKIRREILFNFYPLRVFQSFFLRFLTLVFSLSAIMGFYLPSLVLREETPPSSPFHEIPDVIHFPFFVISLLSLMILPKFVLGDCFPSYRPLFDRINIMQLCVFFGLSFCPPNPFILQAAVPYH